MVEVATVAGRDASGRRAAEAWRRNELPVLAVDDWRQHVLAAAG